MSKSFICKMTNCSLKKRTFLLQIRLIFSLWKRRQYLYCYHDLLCMCLSTRNVEKVFEIVLRDLLTIEVAQLPKSTFAI